MWLPIGKSLRSSVVCLLIVVAVLVLLYGTVAFSITYCYVTPIHTKWTYLLESKAKSTFRKELHIMNVVMKDKSRNLVFISPREEVVEILTYELCHTHDLLLPSHKLCCLCLLANANLISGKDLNRKEERMHTAFHTPRIDPFRNFLCCARSRLRLQAQSGTSRRWNSTQSPVLGKASNTTYSDSVANLNWMMTPWIERCMDIKHLLPDALWLERITFSSQTELPLFLGLLPHLDSGKDLIRKEERMHSVWELVIRGLPKVDTYDLSQGRDPTSVGCDSSKGCLSRQS